MKHSLRREVLIVALVLVLVALSQAAARCDDRPLAYAVAVADLVSTEISRSQGNYEINPILRSIESPIGRGVVHLGLSIGIYEAGRALETRAKQRWLRRLGKGLRHVWVGQAGAVAVNVAVSF